MLKRCRPLLGTFVEITADHDEGIELAFEAIAEVHRLMSAHEPDSDVSVINRFAHLRAVEVHEWTAQVLERALYWARKTDGAFDPVRAGEASVRQNRIPAHPDQPQPQARNWSSVDLRGQLVRTAEPACVDLGGIAKGFAVDRATDALRGAGCVQGLVNAGGDLRGFGRQPWPVTIVDPRTRDAVATVQITDQALATSAGLPSDDALSFDHLGGANALWTSVTVLASTACDADALTKIVWARAERLDGLLADARAKAMGIRIDNSVEPIGHCEELAV